MVLLRGIISYKHVSNQPFVSLKAVFENKSSY